MSERGVRWWIDWALDLLYPPKCTFCHRLLEPDEREGRICRRCRAALEIQQDPLRGEFFNRGVYCFPYRGYVRKSIHRFKFGGRKEYAAVYAGLLLERIREDREICGADLITHVPTNRQNLRRRGYDHAALLAGHLAGELGIPAVTCLRRTRKTKAMYGLRPHERRANILGAIEICCPAEQIAGKTVILTDDIFTTGATAGECSRVLRMAGAGKVFVLTVAKTEKSY